MRLTSAERNIIVRKDILNRGTYGGLCIAAGLTICLGCGPIAGIINNLRMHERRPQELSSPDLPYLAASPLILVGLVLSTEAAGPIYKSKSEYGEEPARLFRVRVRVEKTYYRGISVRTKC